MTFNPNAVLANVRYKAGWDLRIGRSDGRWFLQWRFDGPCAVTGVVEEQACRKWWLSEFMTDGELVQTAFMAAIAAEEHECREFFLYRGRRIFGPHIRLDALMQVCDQIEVRELEGK